MPHKRSQAKLMERQFRKSFNPLSGITTASGILENARSITRLTTTFNRKRSVKNCDDLDVGGSYPVHFKDKETGKKVYIDSCYAAKDFHTNKIKYLYDKDGEVIANAKDIKQVSASRQIQYQKSLAKENYFIDKEFEHCFKK